MHEFVDSCVSTAAVVHAVLCEQSLSRTPYAALRRLVVSMLGLTPEASQEEVGLTLRTHVRQGNDPGV